MGTAELYKHLTIPNEYLYVVMECGVDGGCPLPEDGSVQGKTMYTYGVGWGGCVFENNLGRP